MPSKKIIILLCVIINLVVIKTTFASEQLIFAVDLVRHGDRTPTKLLPKHPHHWQLGLGELTPLGARQEYKLGTVLNSLYIKQYHLLPKSFKQQYIFVRSSDNNRTLMSAESLLLGLYPLGTGPLLTDKVAALPGAFQPVPIHTEARKNDSLLEANHVYHKQYRHLLETTVYNQKDWLEMAKQRHKQLQRWSKLSGLNLTDLKQVTTLATNLKIRSNDGVALPTGFTDQDVTQLNALSDWIKAKKYGSPATAHLIANNLLHTIKEQIDNAINNKSSLHYVLYMAHDTTIQSALSVLGISLLHSPPNAADLRLLLFKADDKYIIQVFYNNHLLQIPGCKKACPWKKFKHKLG